MLFQPSSLLKQGFYIHMRQVLMFHPSLGGNISSSGICTYDSARGPSHRLRSLWDGALRISSGSKKVSRRSESNLNNERNRIIHTCIVASLALAIMASSTPAGFSSLILSGVSGAVGGWRKGENYEPKLEEGSMGSRGLEKREGLYQMVVVKTYCHYHCHCNISRNLSERVFTLS